MIAAFERDLHVLGGRLERKLPDIEAIGDARETAARLAAARPVEIGIGIAGVPHLGGDGGEIFPRVLVAGGLALFDRERQRGDLLPWMLGEMSGVIDAGPAANPRIGRRLLLGAASPDGSSCARAILGAKK